METKKTIVFITHNIVEAVFLSDRVHVMSARPGRLAETIDVNFPRPRTIEMLSDPKAIDLVSKIKAKIERT